MILADTSVWIDHLRDGNEAFARLLGAEQILTHPFVIGELALGHLEPRDLILRYLHNLRSPSLHPIGKYYISSTGIDWSDQVWATSTCIC